MADAKKYKYTVKKFAKMLTVHPEKHVTFQDSVDIRSFFTMRIVHGGPWHESLAQLIRSTMQDITSLQENETNYWANLVEHGHIFSNSNMQVRVLHCEPPFHIRMEFVVLPAVLAEWLAETGFPQMSRAKEETPNGDPDVVG